MPCVQYHVPIHHWYAAMSVKKVTNHAVSVYSRLKNIARVKHLDFSRLLIRYAIERFLYRLGESQYANNFVLKGGNLFIIWQNGETPRTTMDSDFLFFGDASEEHLKKIFTDLVTSNICPEDGMHYLPETIETVSIREEREYGGTRITLNAYLGTAHIPMQFDIGIGDVITPSPESSVFPVLLPLPKPRIKSYPPVTSIAEKLDNMVIRELDNSRMKDFYDIWLLSTLFEYNLKELSNVIHNTLTRRGTNLPLTIPVSLTKEFADNKMKQVQWKAFLRKNGLSDAPQDLHEVIARLSAFLLPALWSRDATVECWNHHTGKWMNDVEQIKQKR